MDYVDEVCWSILKSDYNFFLAAVRPAMDPDGTMNDSVFEMLADDFYKHLSRKYDGPSAAAH